MEWLKNLNATIDYIEENLNGELCYEDVAAVACCSPYYFQRIFSWVVGISLAEYIQKAQDVSGRYGSAAEEGEGIRYCPEIWLYFSYFF